MYVSASILLVRDVPAVRVAADIPRDLHRDVKIVGKRTRMSVAAVITAALYAHVKQFVQSERERKEESVAKPKREPSTVTQLGERTVDVVSDGPIDRLAPIFDQHARRIMEVFNQPQVVLIRQQEAFAAIRRLAPLTYADDAKIVMRLEAIIAEKAAQEENTELPPSTSLSPLVSSAVQTPNPNTIAETIGALAKILQPQAPPMIPIEDPLIGTKIKGRVRNHAALDEDEDE